MNLLRRLAARARVPVFAAVGRNARERIEDLSLTPGIDWVSTPRHASVLFVAGEIPAGDRDALHRLHDQLPHPRATLWWTEPAPGFNPAVTVPPESDPLPALVGLYRRLLLGEQPSEVHLLPDEPPTPWHGRGEHGQGGEDMMGGTPYGRPMPMPPEEDLRDGLALDAYRMQVGPFLPPLPPGLVLELTLQGDVFQSAKLIRPAHPPTATPASAFQRLRHARVPISALERARAAHHLRCAAGLLVLLGLLPQALRLRAAARSVERGGPIALGALRRSLKLCGAFAAIVPDLGRLDEREAGSLGGVPARAAGHRIDTREGHPAYRKLGFEPVTQTQGDVRARLMQWLHEAQQAAWLATRAPAGACVEPGDGIESPWGTVNGASPSRDPEFCVTELLPGLEWGEGMLVLASFDPASLGRLSPASETTP